MSYIGSTPTTQSFISGTDYFNGDGSTVAFTLSRSVVSVNDIEVVINNVEQQPNTAYTVSGTTITFTSAPSSGTSNIYVRYLSTTTQSITPSQNTVSYSTLNSDTQSKLGISFKNRIINGACLIDQRNAGASISVSTDTGQYGVDRMNLGASGGGVFSAQQTTTAPAGFYNSLKLTVTTPQASPSGANYYFIRQRIEGYNCADLNWGTANAQSVTISFWVQASVTGTYSIGITATGTSATYCAPYTISAANTWTKVSITVPGPTIGTWGTTNNSCIELFIPIGLGTTYGGTANTWTAGAYYMGVTGTTNLISTNGATFYLTGVQLEVGTQATTFDYRSYGTEFDLCQRYYQIVSNGVVCCCESGTTSVLGSVIFPTCMRTLPSVSPSAAMRISDIAYSGFVQSSAAASIGSGNSGDAVRVRMPNFTGLTTARWYMQTNDSSAGVLQFSAEL